MPKFSKFLKSGTLNLRYWLFHWFLESNYDLYREPNVVSGILRTRHFFLSFNQNIYCYLVIIFVFAH